MLNRHGDRNTRSRPPVRGHRAKRAVRPRSAGRRRLLVGGVVAALISGLLVLTGALSASGATTVLIDPFDRTVSGGWGEVEGFGSYQAGYDAAALAVDGGTGTMTLRPGQPGRSDVPTPALLESRTWVDIAVSDLASQGNGTFTGIVARQSNGRAYRAVARFASDRRLVLSIDRIDGSPDKITSLAAMVVPDLTTYAGSYVRLRFDVRGTDEARLRAKVWEPGSVEPTSGLETVDSSDDRIREPGKTSLWSYVSSSSPASQARFDNLILHGSTGALEPLTGSTPLPAPTPTTAPTQPSEPTSAPSPRPTATPTPTPSVPPTPQPTVPPTTPVAGAAPVGSTSYPIPQDAIFVAPGGSDSADGSAGAPLRTLTKAIAAASNGSTIVMRGGTYHESVLVPQSKPVTIQPYPREAVYLDGSSAVSGFVKSGSAWVASGWSAQFDRSPTYGRGKPDGTAEGFRWLNPKFPYAAWPDQVFIDGKPLTQVGSPEAVTAGTFFVDYATDRLFLGSDPAGRSVRASDLAIGMTLTAPGTVVRGIGLRRFATPTPDMGTLRLFGDDQTIENVEVVDNATAGVTVYGSGVTLRNVTSSRNGLIGFHAHRSDDYTAVSVLAEDNNTQRFNFEPAAGGLKITQSRHVSITDSVIRDNHATGLWFDVSDYDVTVAGNQVIDNARDGIVVELAGTVKVVNNVVRGSAQTGVFVLDSSEVQLWNNEISGGELPLRISEGPRVASGADAGVTWVMKNVTVRNNLIGGLTEGDNWCAVACVLDDRRLSTAAQMNVTFDGNVFQRTAPNRPSTLIRWAGGSGGAVDFPTLGAMKSAVGQEASGAEVIAPSLAAATIPRAGVPVPAAVASILGLATGTARVGPTRR